ncbi:DUF6262 family protein [Streptomyces sp. NPDC005790]|uniref:DUF6262 family protein n=1 Tax=Streptomyces sp. NPDC005790 TaxID=3154777 RepID=UPI0033C36824
MSTKLLLENMRDTSGFFQQDVLEVAWAAVPERFRTVDLVSDGLEPADLGAFTLGRQQHSLRLRFFRLPAPMDREMAWCCWRLVELGGRVPVGSLQSLINSLARAVEEHPDLRGSLMREWERILAAAYARHYGRLPGKGSGLNAGTVLRRYYQILWTAYDQRPWWQREVWDPVLDPRIPLRAHEPLGDHGLYFQSLQPLWLRNGFQWYRKVWLIGQHPAPPTWLCDEPAEVRAFMLDYLSHVRAQTARPGPNRGKPLSPLRVNDIITDGSAAAQARAEQGLREMIRQGKPITFRGLAQTAGVSLDFLYRRTELRRRVEQLRTQQRSHPPQPVTQPPDDSPSSVVRTFTAQLAGLKRRHRDEVQALRRALETARSENLECRAASAPGAPPIPKYPDGDLLP